MGNDYANVIFVVSSTATPSVVTRLFGGVSDFNGYVTFYPANGYVYAPNDDLTTVTVLSS